MIRPMGRRRHIRARHTRGRGADIRRLALRVLVSAALCAASQAASLLPWPASMAALLALDVAKTVVDGLYAQGDPEDGRHQGPELPVSHP